MVILVESFRGIKTKKMPETIENLLEDFDEWYDSYSSPPPKSSLQGYFVRKFSSIIKSNDTELEQLQEDLISATVALSRNDKKWEMEWNKMLDKMNEEGHGGGNWRRLIIQARKGFMNEKKCFIKNNKKYHCFIDEYLVEDMVCICGETKVINNIITKQLSVDKTVDKNV